ncbi:hypothetical protein [Pseudoroseicyclus sp. CXY001]|uniref:hypothetical protein n=1 Tax=Pseudoroseicyclus sp. CXY001 TaxID=3242492 RepID=UPI00357147FB
MRLIKTLTAAALATTVAGSAMAGGFAPVVEVPEVVVIEDEPATGFSLPVWVIPAAVLTALVAVAAASGTTDD